MSTSKNNNSQNEQNKAEEPEVPFKAIRIFSSFEEQKKEEIKWLAAQSPEQHLQNATSLIKRVFTEDLKRNPEIGSQIHFK